MAALFAAPPTPASVAAVASYGRSHNVKLLGLMNAVTSDLQQVSDQRANLLRLVQTGGIVLALLNFVFILFKFIRRLRTSDQAAEQANEENREILGSVNEGLFLLTPELRLGSQISTSVGAIFGRAVQPDENFIDLLAPLVSAKTLDDARGYVELLLSPHVKEQLARGLNPLSEVELRVSNRLGERETKFIALRFNRAHADDGSVRHLLVTVQDVTAVVELQRKLASQHQHAQQEFDMLLDATRTDPGALRQFVQRAEAQLLDINALLQSAGDVRVNSERARLLERVARLMHTFKGDASSLGLALLAQKAHQFETELAQLREHATQDGGDLLALPPLLDELLGKLKLFKQLAERLQPAHAQAAATPTSAAPAARDMRPATSSAPAAQALAQQLQTLAAHVAADEGKLVAVQAQVDALGELPAATLERLREICVQLVRNAVVHGIEPQSQRLAAGKAELGLVQLSLERNGDDYLLKAHDDGVGISVERIRARLIALGWFNAAQLDAMAPRDVVMQMFKPGFSTAAQASAHSGCGVGLDVVFDAVKRIGGRIMLSTQPGRHTEFRVLFAA